MSFKIMEDTITPSSISGNPWAVAGYIAGFWPDAGELKRMFPHAYHLFIGIHADEQGWDAIDMEGGDETVPGGAQGISNRIKAGHKPPHLDKWCGYSAASNVEEFITLMSDHGHPRDEYFVWSAHTGRGEHVCGPNAFGPGQGCGYPQADFTQYTFSFEGRNIDGSMVPASGIFIPHGGRVILLPDPHHYRWYASSVKPTLRGQLPGGPFAFELNGKLISADEARTARRYDALRKLQTHLRHPHRNEIDDLKEVCSLLAQRIRAVVDQQTVHGHAPWHDFRHFRFRHDSLVARSHGDRVAG